MPRVLRFSALAPQRGTPAAAPRVVLRRLIDDLQLIAFDRPVALAAIAELADRLAAPVRRRLRRPLKATLRPRAQKRSG